MKSNELLLLAMSEIDDELITEAAVPFKASPFKILKRISAIAASLFLILSLGIILRFALTPEVGGGASAPESSDKPGYGDQTEDSQPSEGDEEEDEEEESDEEE